jgi:hypothetical protein
MESISFGLVSELREFISRKEVTEMYRTSKQYFTRVRKLPFCRVSVLILQGWKRSMQDRVNKFFRALNMVADHPTASAFCQAREKIRPEFFKAITGKVLGYFYERYEKEGLVQRWKERLLWAVDCSYFNLPDTEEVRERYSVQVNQYSEEGQVQALGSVLYDVLNEIAINSELDKKKSEKSFIFDSHGKYMRQGVVCLYDRLYSDYSVVAFHAKKGVDFIIRCRLSNTFKVIEEFVKSKSVDEIVTLKVTSKQKKFVKDNELPQQVKVRLVKVELDNGEMEVLMTSLLDSAKYTREDFKWAYNKRWGIETYYDRLKNLLEVERFSSEKVIGIEQDFYGRVFLTTLESVLSKEDEAQIAEEYNKKREQEGIYQYKMNKSTSYSSLVDYTVDLLLNFNRSPSEVVQELRIMFQSGLIPERPGRHFERKERTACQKLKYHKYTKRVCA